MMPIGRRSSECSRAGLFRRGRAPAKDPGSAGSVTIEAAVSIACLVVVFSLIVGGLVTLARYLAAIDAAGAAARSHAIGLDYLPVAGVDVSVVEQDGLMAATAKVQTFVGPLEARAVFPVEYR